MTTTIKIDTLQPLVDSAPQFLPSTYEWVKARGAWEVFEEAADRLGVSTKKLRELLDHADAQRWTWGSATTHTVIEHEDGDTGAVNRRAVALKERNYLAALRPDTAEFYDGLAMCLAAERAMQDIRDRAAEQLSRMPVWQALQTWYAWKEADDKARTRDNQRRKRERGDAPAARAETIALSVASRSRQLRTFETILETHGMKIEGGWIVGYPGEGLASVGPCAEAVKVHANIVRGLTSAMNGRL
jgi:hypothetical protein